MNPDNIIVHHSFQRTSFDFDIALLHLAKPVKFTQIVRPICVPINNKNYQPGAKCFVAGWGHTNETAGRLPDKLRFVEVSETMAGKTPQLCSTTAPMCFYGEIYYSIEQYELSLAKAYKPLCRKLRAET